MNSHQTIDAFQNLGHNFYLTLFLYFLGIDRAAWIEYQTHHYIQEEQTIDQH